MKIAFLLRKFPTLSETFILNQITGLIDIGHKVEIYAIYRGDLKNAHRDFYKYNLLEKTYYPPSVPHNPVLRILKAIYLFIGNLTRIQLLLQSINVFKYGRQAASLYLFYLSLLIKEPKSYDIIHCHFGLIGLIGVDLRDLGLITGKVVTSFHGFGVNVYPKLHGNEVYNRLIQQGDLYTVNSNFILEKLSKIGFAKENIVKLPVGVNLNKYTPIFKKPHSEKIHIITVARLTECKGIEYSIKAVANLAQVYPNLLYQIVGEGELRSQLESLIQELEVQAQIKLIGQKTQDELRDIYAKSHIFILSSIVASDGSQEGQGLVLQEAQAMGLPVIATRIGGIPEGVLESKSAFLVPERDVEALTMKLRYLLENPEMWEEMGQAGCDFVTTNYSLDSINNHLISLYQSLLD